MICIKSSLEFSEVNLAVPGTRLEVFGVKVGGYAIFVVHYPLFHHIQTDSFDYLSRFGKVLKGNFNAHHCMWCSLSSNHNSRALLSDTEAHD